MVFWVPRLGSPSTRKAMKDIIRFERRMEQEMSINQSFLILLFVVAFATGFFFGMGFMSWRSRKRVEAMKKEYDVEEIKNRREAEGLRTIKGGKK